MSRSGRALPRTSKALTWLRRARAPLPLGVCGALLVFLSLAGMLVVVHPAFLSADESHHLDHAWRVGHGELPEFYDGIDPGSGLPASRYQWTSQHPPLFYVLLAPVVRPLLDDRRWLAATMAGRLMVVTIGALVVLTIAWATARITREPDPTVIVGAAMVAAVVSPFVAISAAVYNDSLAVLAATAALGLAADMLRRGPTTGGLVALTAACAVGFGTRAAFLVVMLVVALAVAVASLRAGVGKRPVVRLLPAVGRVSIVLAVPLISSGWFYARNRRLTGHWTGSISDPRIRQTLGRTTRSFVDVATDLEVWRRGIGGLLGPSATDEILPLALVAVVAGLAGARVIRAMVKNVAMPDVLVGGLLFLVFAGIAAQYVQHVSGAGGTNPRYLLPALLPICLGAAYGLRAWGRTRGALLIGFSVLAAGLILQHSVRFLQLRRFGPTVGIWESWTRGADINHIPRFVIPTLLGSLMFGLVLQAVALWRLTSPARLAGADGRVMSTRNASEVRSKAR